MAASINHRLERAPLSTATGHAMEAHRPLTPCGGPIPSDRGHVAAGGEAPNCGVSEASMADTDMSVALAALLRELLSLKKTGTAWPEAIGESRDSSRWKHVCAQLTPKVLDYLSTIEKGGSEPKTTTETEAQFRRDKVRARCAIHEAAEDIARLALASERFERATTWMLDHPIHVAPAVLAHHVENLKHRVYRLLHH